jgi:hypothetical protein
MGPSCPGAKTAEVTHAIDGEVKTAKSEKRMLKNLYDQTLDDDDAMKEIWKELTRIEHYLGRDPAFR